MAKKKQPSQTIDDPEEGGELAPTTPPVKSIEIEYNHLKDGFSVYRCEDGEREEPPLIWHENNLTDCIKRLSQERDSRIVITIEMRKTEIESNATKV